MKNAGPEVVGRIHMHKDRPWVQFSEMNFMALWAIISFSEVCSTNPTYWRRMMFSFLLNVFIDDIILLYFGLHPSSVESFWSALKSQRSNDVSSLVAYSVGSGRSNYCWSEYGIISNDERKSILEMFCF
jgi:hypothetical protein